MNATDRAPDFSPRLVLWHWLGARASLGFAVALALREPSGLLSSPFHPTALACAHLVVLGFLVPSVLGGFVASRKLALALPARGVAVDAIVLATTLVVASGVASHMLLGTYSGVTWSGGLLVLALLLRLPTACADLLLADAPLPLRAGVAFAFVALLLTVCLGIALAIDLAHPFLPAGHAQALVGHAHLGLFGFAFLMFAALGQRLLPMFVPAAPAPLPVQWAVVGSLAIGGYGFGATRPFVGDAFQWPAFALGMGASLFALDVVRMFAFRKPPPRELPRAGGFAVLLVAALVALLAALGIGAALASGLFSDPRLALAYGVLLLLGFFGSAVLGVGSRLLPLCAWHEARARLARAHADLAPERRPLPPAPLAAASQRTHRLVAAAWGSGVALLLASIANGSEPVAILALSLLLLAVLGDTAWCLAAWRAGTRVT